ncbi:MAG: hypothetical protein KIT83_12135 [Bryobacterales bacterium]|nr:hypothetical protein [Bryobacterales bacterium]
MRSSVLPFSMPAWPGPGQPALVRRRARDGQQETMMAALFAKLNWKGHSPLAILNTPEAVIPLLREAPEAQRLSALEGSTKVPFVLAFGSTLAEVQRFAKLVKTHTEGDAVVWFAYPKQSSRRHRCEFNRDTGWAALGDAGFEPVRQVSIDDDWSALRFRRVEFIQSLKRDPKRALSQGGKARAGS